MHCLDILGSAEFLLLFLERHPERRLWEGSARAKDPLKRSAEEGEM